MQRRLQPIRVKLKHQMLWLRTFDTIESLRLALQAFKQLYNHEWLVQKHRNLTPAAVRARFSNPAQAAA